MAQRETVSVIIPAHNAAVTLGRALDSVLVQSEPVHEILVIDDGSKDDTGRIAASYAQHGVELITLPARSGAAAARNAGIERARGDYLAFLDADDEWLPDKNRRQLEIISKDAAVVFVSCHAFFVSKCPNTPTLANYDRPPATGPGAWKTLLAYSYVTASSVIARRDAVIATGMFDPETCPAEDQDLWIRLARHGEVGFVEDALVRYYDTPGSVTKQDPAYARAKVLGFVHRHIAGAGDSLTPKERRQIRALRYSWLGRTAYAEGDFRHGIPLLVRAASLGHEPWQNLRYLLVASPPAQMLKHWLRLN